MIRPSDPLKTKSGVPRSSISLNFALRETLSRLMEMPLKSTSSPPSWYSFADGVSANGLDVPVLNGISKLPVNNGLLRTCPAPITE
jgi:hypothetical protein